MRPTIPSSPHLTCHCNHDKRTGHDTKLAITTWLRNYSRGKLQYSINAIPTTFRLSMPNKTKYRDVVIHAFISVINDIVMNKNVPAGLFIFHSSYPSTFRTTLGSLDPHVEELSSVLSAQAQDDAIAKFGIAGRVWYTPLSIISWSPYADGK